MAGFKTRQLDIFFYYTFSLRKEAYENQNTLVENWCIHNESVRELKTALDKFCRGKQEEDLYNPFVTMCTWFIKRAQDEHKAMVQRNIVVKKHDVKSIAEINSRKPDAVIVAADGEIEKTWSTILCAIELKKIEDNKRLHPDGEDEGDEQPKKRSRGSKPVSGQVLGEGARGRGKGKITSQGVLGSTPVSESVSGSHGSILTQDANTPNAGEQARAATVIAAQAQLGGYAMETLTACERPLDLGMLVQGTRLTLWCFQRTIAVRSIQLDLARDFEVLGTQNMDLDASAIWQKQVHALKCAVVTAGLGEDDSLVAGEITSQLRSITGRATQIWKVTVKQTEDHLGMVLSWKHKDSQLEVEFICEPRTVLSVSDNIMKAFAHGIVEDVSATERLEPIGLGTDMLRVPHLLLVEEYSPIWELKGEKKFWDVVVQLCNCLHALYSKREILYRDISIGNVCFLEYGSKTICKLIDFDHATHFGMRTSTSEATNHSGTAPFMACEVLDTNPEGYVRRLHHDFESVLYMCVWHAFGFTFDDIPDKNHPINNWRAGSWKDKFVAKIYFTSAFSHGSAILGTVTDEIHKGKCKKLLSAFYYASKKNDELHNAYESKRVEIDRDERVAWDKVNPPPEKYARYAMFPTIMESLGHKANACTEDCCVQPMSPMTHRASYS